MNIFIWRQLLVQPFQFKHWLRNQTSSLRPDAWAPLRSGCGPAAVQLNEREETFLEDVEDGGEEEGQSQEDEQLVRQLSAVVLEDQLPPQVDGSRHVLELLVGFLHCPGWGGCGEKANTNDKHDLRTQNRQSRSWFYLVIFTQWSNGVLALHHLLRHHSADGHQTLCDVARGFHQAFLGHLPATNRRMKKNMDCLSSLSLKRIQ